MPSWCRDVDGRLLILELPWPEAVLVFRHIDAPAAEAYTLHLEPRALLKGSFVPEFDRATGADDALPGQGTAGFAQHLHHLAMI